MEVVLCKCCGEVLEKFENIYICFNWECYNYKRSVSKEECEISNIEKFLEIKKGLESLLKAIRYTGEGDYYIAESDTEILNNAKDLVK